jgi:DNA-binding response OmpR family regulator
MGTPIVFLTGRTSREDEKQAMDAGAFAYLIKPFKFEELLDVIAAALASVGKEAPARSAGPVV